MFHYRTQFCKYKHTFTYFAYICSSKGKLWTFLSSLPWKVPSLIHLFVGYLENITYKYSFLENHKSHIERFHHIFKRDPIALFFPSPGKHTHLTQFKYELSIELNKYIFLFQLNSDRFFLMRKDGLEKLHLYQIEDRGRQKQDQDCFLGFGRASK